MKKDLPIFGLIVLISAVVVYFYTQPTSNQTEDVEVVSQEQSIVEDGEIKNEVSEVAYVPKPIDMRSVPIPFGGFKRHTSPNGEYIAHSYSDEQGETGVYITDTEDKRLTATYCGSFQRWAPNNQKITAFLSSSCTNKNQPIYLNLYIDGKAELTEDYEEIFSVERNTELFPLADTAYNYVIINNGSMVENYYAIQVSKRHPTNGAPTEIIVVKSEKNLEDLGQYELSIKYDSELKIYVVTKIVGEFIDV